MPPRRTTTAAVTSNPISPCQGYGKLGIVVDDVAAKLDTEALVLTLVVVNEVWVESVSCILSKTDVE